MAIIKTVEGKTPHWGKNCFIAENAALTGDCTLGDDCSIWYSAVLHSDVDAILGRHSCQEGERLRTRTGRGICQALCWIHQGLVFEENMKKTTAFGRITFYLGRR